jgi:hypothetical protein
VQSLKERLAAVQQMVSLGAIDKIPYSRLHKLSRVVVLEVENRLLKKLAPK